MNSRYQLIVRHWKWKTEHDTQGIVTALKDFGVLFAYHSDAIERTEASLQSVLEIENQKVAFRKLLRCAAEKSEITPDLICEMHRLLMRGCYDNSLCGTGEFPGAFRKHDYVTGDDVGAFAQDVPEEIAELCDELKDFSGDVLTAAAYLHLVFESIHPFADGNGRTGRSLMNYWLMLHDYPPVNIYAEDKRTYFLALATFDKTGRIDGFVQFLKEEAVKTWGNTMLDMEVEI